MQTKTYAVVATNGCEKKIERGVSASDVDSVRAYYAGKGYRVFAFLESDVLACACAIYTKKGLTMSRHVQILTLCALLCEMSDESWVWDSERELFVNSNDGSDTLTFDVANRVCAGTIIDLQGARLSWKYATLCVK